MAKQELELAQYETEMEKRKIDIEMQKEKIVREMRFKFQLEEKEVDLLAWRIMKMHLMKIIRL